MVWGSGMHGHTIRMQVARTRVRTVDKVRVRKSSEPTRRRGETKERREGEGGGEEGGSS